MGAVERSSLQLRICCLLTMKTLNIIPHTSRMMKGGESGRDQAHPHRTSLINEWPAMSQPWPQMTRHERNIQGRTRTGMSLLKMATGALDAHCGPPDRQADGGRFRRQRHAAHDEGDKRLACHEIFSFEVVNTIFPQAPMGYGVSANSSAHQQRTAAAAASLVLWLVVGTGIYSSIICRSGKVLLPVLPRIFLTGAPYRDCPGWRACLV